MHQTLRDEIVRRAPEVRASLARNLACNPRLFGSVARGEDTPTSDIDILIDAEPGCSLLDIAGIELELSAAFGRRVDVRTLFDLHPKMRAPALADAVPL